MITADEMRQLEQDTIGDGVDAATLMERAGMRVADVVDEHNDGDVYIFVGTGNNGGDGLVAARHLVHTMNVTVILLGELDGLPAEEQSRLPARVTVTTFEDFDPSTIAAEDTIVDAMLGIGITAELRSPYETAVHTYNKLEGTKIAVDIPTGVHPDNGPNGPHSDCDIVITFHDTKLGLQDLNTDVVVADIGLSERLNTSAATS
jgi:NAD(P)H-hydrate epimerase